jgi:RNA polymerase sigma factor (sigma-70 family)
MIEGEQWLAEYAQTGSEAAFREVVERYVNLVYSAAIRLVNGDTHLAEDVTQKVFADLAGMARKISRDVKLGGWLHRHTCFVANNTMRGERRRQLRERSAVEMNSMEDHSEENLALIAPVLDEAINELGAEDRDAIMLRFFEQKDFRTVGEALGSNEDAARKRVDRALDKLHGSLTRRGVVLSATALTATLASQAVTAAPVGLALSISTAAVASAAAGGGTALTLIQIMAKAKIGIAAAVVVAVAIPVAMSVRHHQALRAENESLRAQAAQIEKLSAENARLAKLAEQGNAAPTTASSNDPSREMLKLRGEVGRLRTEASAPKPSPLSAVISDPETRRMIREQQKMGMGMIYKQFGERLKLPPEQGQKFVELLADDIMENVDHVGALLRDGKSREEIDQVFTAQEAAMVEKVKALLGQEQLSQYQDYTRNLGSYLTAEQFKGEMTGDKAAKDEKSKQLYEVMQQETRAVLGELGLSEDFQTLPILNFRNIASEQEAERNLRLMDSIYERAVPRASSFLSPDELKKFAEFRAKAVANSRAALTMNRRMMAPGGQ